MYYHSNTGLASNADVEVSGLQFESWIDSETIVEGVERVAEQITDRYRYRRPVVVCVLNGAAIFHADLIRRLHFPLEVDYIRVSSYEGGTESTGRVRFTAAGSTEIEGRNVIIVEDIVDTGRTGAALRQHFRELGALQIEMAALLYKPEADLIGVPPEYVAFEIPNRFVVGYGLDYRGEGRNLPAIYALKVQTQSDEPDRER